MKQTILILVFLLAGGVAFSQSKGKKLTKEEMSRMTPEQRLVHETNRKDKGHGVSTKKKVKLQKKQSRKSEHIHQPKRKKPKKG